MSKEAMKLALEAMKRIQNADMDCDFLNVRQADQLDEAITALREALAYQPAQQEPVVLKWQQAPVKTQWGDEMVVASVAIDNDHTLSLYCERDQTPKVDAMFAQRTWVGLTDEEITDIWAEASPYYHEDDFARAIEAKLKQRNT